MGGEKVREFIEAARKYGPQIESALTGVKDKDVRRAIATAAMTTILQEVAGVQTSSRRIDFPSFGVRSKRGKKGSFSGTQGRIAELVAEGYFSEPRLAEQVQDEMRMKGYHHNEADVRMSLLRLARKKILRRIATAKGKKQVFAYVRS